MSLVKLGGRWRGKRRDPVAEIEATCGMCMLPPPVREFKFKHGRRWRFDLAWPARSVAVEIEGGSWIRGRHVRPKGYAADCEKYNEAARIGWIVLRYTPEMVFRGMAQADLLDILPKRAPIIAEPADRPMSVYKEHEKVWDLGSHETTGPSPNVQDQMDYTALKLS